LKTGERRRKEKKDPGLEACQYFVIPLYHPTHCSVLSTKGEGGEGKRKKKAIASPLTRFLPQFVLGSISIWQAEVEKKKGGKRRKRKGDGFIGSFL